MKTTSILLPAILLVSACATTGTLRETEKNAARSPGQIELVASSSSRTFPAMVSVARLPAADRLNHRIHAERNGTIAADVRLCVASSGQVSGIEVAKSSGMPEFDAALVDGIADWQYVSFSAPDGARVCENVTVAYIAY